MNKTFRMALLLLLSPGISLAGWSQTKQVFAITDRSEVTGVLQISGTVSSSEQYIANELVSSCGIEASAKNISGKPILLVIAALDVRAPLGGCFVHHVYQMEMYFGEAIKPDEEIPLEVPHPTGTTTGSGNPLSSPREPLAEARLLYVQYDDGSVLGDESAAREVLARRAAYLQSLRKLAAAYQSGGEEAFSAALNEEFPKPVERQIGRYRQVAQADGVPAAVNLVRSKLRSAESNQARLTKTAEKRV